MTTFSPPAMTELDTEDSFLVELLELDELCCILAKEALLIPGLMLCTRLGLVKGPLGDSS